MAQSSPVHLQHYSTARHTRNAPTTFAGGSVVCLKGKTCFFVASQIDCSGRPVSCDTGNNNSEKILGTPLGCFASPDKQAVEWTTSGLRSSPAAKMDYEDDAHFCLKCHSTIMGLDNYVTHRKSAACRKLHPDPSKSPLEEVEEEIGLKADDFFSSLELRSSSSVKPVVSASGKGFSGILTRSKYSAALQASTSKEPVESKSGKNVWIGGNQLKDLGTGDNQSKLIKAVANLERRKDAAPADSPPRIAGAAVYEDSDDDSEVFDYEEDETSDEDQPPQGHTGGKWKPSSPVPWQAPSSPGGGKRPTCPPPTYTKGKWKPAEEEAVAPPTAGGKRQFWCRPCNRSLASKVVFQRHLRSGLHHKRSKAQPLPAPALPEAAPPSSKRPRLHTCAVCRAKVKKPLMGKHLISHYHFSRGDISSPANRQLVLDNILGVVLESPFQCNMCKFYCNTLGQFVAHWRSGAHLAEELKRPDGHFLCDFCRHKAPSSEQMLSHLESAEHLEVAQAINRSVPICIRRLQEIPCSVCWQRFVLNRQLLTHSRLHHPDPMGDEVHQCGRCPKVLGSAISLQQHLRRAHQEPSYFCNTCAMRFKSGEEARKHRLSIQHRYARLDLAKDGRQRRRCQHCGDMFQNFLLLKEHLGLRHPEHKIRCPQCGAQFIIPQELTNHLKNCTFPTGEPSQSSSFSCDRCAYSSNSSAELLFHVALHKAPDPSTRPKLKCPLCERLFPRNSLQAHLRIHTQERPYECKVCYARFARKSNLQNHQKNHERVQAAPRKAATDPDDRAFLCSTCGTGFNRRLTSRLSRGKHLSKRGMTYAPGLIRWANVWFGWAAHKSVISSGFTGRVGFPSRGHQSCGRRTNLNGTEGAICARQLINSLAVKGANAHCPIYVPLALPPLHQLAHKHHFFLALIVNGTPYITGGGLSIVKQPAAEPHRVRELI
ncbi:hypothetical protein D910_04183 [Dendroctonus ponderosae]|uniref:C2H2-type domain-containing protein n=1 Tax=Dendroctonus ponderosae TaxID=77166 RepID=U4U125_DENPD|nr:hypothetical protein D910_04183 [Dendroctonus ponderosae]